MTILSLRDISLSFGAPPLLDHVTFSLTKGERVCLLGRNGVGKTSLLKIITGQQQPDSGQLWRQDGLRVGYLSQDATTESDLTVFDVVVAGLGDSAQLVSDYYRLSHHLSDEPTASQLHQLAIIQQQLDAQQGWEAEQRAERTLNRLGLQAETPFATLSGGWRRRALLAQALVCEPDLLILDEPTNHLDLTVIEWLEDFLLSYQGTILFVTHDRRFLRRLATRILELDRGLVTDWPGDYDQYLRRREERWHAEAVQQARFDKQLAEEEQWIRQGIKARRTRNEGRVRALEAMRRERQARRERSGTMRAQLHNTERSGQLVIEADQIEFSWQQQQPIIRTCSVVVQRGDRVGVIGANGSGKTTLLRILLGDLEPTSGYVRHGTQLQIAYFDQQRLQLDPEATVCDNVAGGREYIDCGGASKHVMSYLKDFLFTPDRARQPITALSGGERNRLLLAKLFTLPANVLVLDEPTNDLDLETLDLLEDLLHQFTGTLLLVSHDRDLLDRLVTSTLAMTGDGQVTETIGGYSDWLAQQSRQAEPSRTAKTKRSDVTPPQRQREPTKKLSYHEQRALQHLPQQIEALEQEQHQVSQQLADPNFYQQATGAVIAAATDRLHSLEAELTQLYAQWETLELKMDP
jgi:ATP-binding cassette subfamily F protein uup